MSGRYVVIGMVLVGVLVGSVIMVKKIRPTANITRVEANDFKVKGPANAPVQIVEYADFQCPACQRAQASLQELVNKYPDKIQVVFRHFPLPGHQWSGFAHQAAECAGRAGRFWDYYDKLFVEQQIWSKSPSPVDMLIYYAREFGLNLDSFGACLADKKVQQSILSEKAKGEAMKITATPTLFVNGERMVGPAEFTARGEAAVRKTLGLPPLPTPSPTPTPEPAVTSNNVEANPSPAEAPASS